MDQLLAPPDLAQIVSCVAGYDPNALPVSRVQEVIRRFVQPQRTGMGEGAPSDAQWSLPLLLCGWQAWRETA